MSNKRLSLIIALLYVTIGTFYGYFELYGAINSEILGAFFTPSNFMAKLIMLFEREPLLPLLTSQSITLSVVYFLVWGIVQSSRDDQKEKTVNKKH